MQRATRQRRYGWWVAGVLALFSLALYARILFTDRVLASGDILLYFYPYRDYAAQALREGRIPFWNPYVFMGAPFLANPQAAVLYPLHWPLIWLDAPKQVAWSAAIHTWLLAFGGALLARRMGLKWTGALVTGVALAGSGFVGGLIGHINQLNGAAWLPWILLLVTPRSTATRPTRLLLDAALLALAVTLLLLSGHTQTAYIVLFGTGAWTIYLGFAGIWQSRPRRLRNWNWRPIALFALGVAVGALIAAPQLLPTLELAGQGIRSGGLGFLEATSFSLNPLHLIWTLLPTYGLLDPERLFDTPAWTEFIAYLGLIGLGLAIVGVWKGRGLIRAGGILFALLGLALALGRWDPIYAPLHAWVPGFDLFRTPARWMLLYTLGVALLAGGGTDALVAMWTRSGRSARILQVLIPGALAIELLIAALGMPHSHPTAAQADFSLRSAPAHLLTDPTRATAGDAAAPRFLGMSTITYDPGDQADYHRLLVENARFPLSEDEFREFIIALKVQELLAPNLPLLWRIPAVDGYDGGVLPLHRYNLLASLLMPEGVEPTDGRLREQVREVPPAALLKLLDVGYLVTDKVRDLWFENVFYDRQIGAQLTAEAPVTTIHTPAPFEATHLDLIASLAGNVSSLQGGARTIGRVHATGTDQDGAAVMLEYDLTAGDAPGALLADGALDSPMAAASGATVAYRDVEGKQQEYRVRLPLASPSTLDQIDIRLTDPGYTLTVQAATLLDDRTGMFSALLPSDRGNFRLAHSGDVKVYQVEDPVSRAWLVPATDVVQTAAEAVEKLRAGIDPEQVAIVEGGPYITGTLQVDDRAEVVSYAPERVEVRTSAAKDSLLVLADAWYPGWHATVDGAETAIVPTNVLFRGVAVPEGEHTVIFTWQSEPFTQGLWLAATGIVLLILLTAAGILRARRPLERGV